MNSDRNSTWRVQEIWLQSLHSWRPDTDTDADADAERRSHTTSRVIQAAVNKYCEPVATASITI